MGRIPLNPTGIAAVDIALRAIDEAISELYSQHGTQIARDIIEANSLQLNSDIGPFTALQKGQIFRDLCCIGMVSTDINGNILYSKNVESYAGPDTVSRVAPGRYYYRFKSSVQEGKYIVIPALNKNAAAGNLFTISAEITAAEPNQFRIEISDSVNRSDYEHTAICFGELP